MVKINFPLRFLYENPKFPRKFEILIAIDQRTQNFAVRVLTSLDVLSDFKKPWGYLDTYFNWLLKIEKFSQNQEILLKNCYPFCFRFFIIWPGLDPFYAQTY